METYMKRFALYSICHRPKKNNVSLLPVCTARIVFTRLIASISVRRVEIVYNLLEASYPANFVPLIYTFFILTLTINDSLTCFFFTKYS